MPQALTPNQEAWLSELPNRKQTNGTLCRLGADGVKSFCCLGVAVDVARAADPEIAANVREDEDTDPGVVVYEEESVNYSNALLPSSVEGWLGLQIDPVETGGGPPYTDLANMNDVDGFSFGQIAEHVRRHAERYFLPPDEPGNTRQ